MLPPPPQHIKLKAAVEKSLLTTSRSKGRHSLFFLVWFNVSPRIGQEVHLVLEPGPCMGPSPSGDREDKRSTPSHLVENPGICKGSFKQAGAFPLDVQH